MYEYVLSLKTDLKTSQKAVNPHRELTHICERSYLMDLFLSAFLFQVYFYYLT